MNEKGKRILALSILVIMLLVLCGASGERYARSESWVWMPQENSKEVDLFYLAPTVYRGDEANFNMSFDNEAIKAKFLGAANMEKGIYEDSCNLYAPYYRQAALSIFDLPEDERARYINIAYSDVRSAFLYYMENLNDGRPVILAGFSQGADMTLRLLEEFYADGVYQDKLVAAYVIGVAVTPEALAEYPHLKMAECASDIGCIISFNSEAENITSSAVVPNKTVGINPLNWKTDSTPASAEENIGACFTDYDGNITEEMTGLCGAYLDSVRGTLKVTGISPKDYPPKLELFGEGVYHSYDYQFFFRNLQENVALRTRQYLTLKHYKENYATVETKSAEKTESAPYLSITANVSPEMLDAQYWIDKIQKPNDVLMTPEEIAAFNALSDGDYSRLTEKTAPHIINAQELKDKLAQMGAPWYECYLNGVAPNADYWAALEAQKNVSAVRDTNELRYGICVDRASLRILPTDDKISTSPEFTFYDELQNSTTMYNEPIVILHESTDGEWLYVLTSYCDGWIHKKSVAICASYDEWEKAQSFTDFLVVTDDKIRTEHDPVDEHSSELELSMGVRLELAPATSLKKTAEGRYGCDSYVVKLPYRADDGGYAFSYAYMPVSRGVHVGYLDYTPANVLRLAFNSDGSRYGWGGMYNARDCSQFVMELYRCFGLNLERNSEFQAAMQCHTLRLDGMSEATKCSMLDALPAGSILHFPGHIMLYLGEAEGRYYVISSVGSMCPADSTQGEVFTYQSVMVNDLSVTRRNGRTWLDNLCCAKTLWEVAA